MARRAVRPRSCSFGTTTGQTAGAIVADLAQLGIDVGGFLQDLDLEVAHRAADFLHFAVGHQLDLGMARHVHHLGRQNTLRAVQRREGFGQLQHVAADGGQLLDQDHFQAGIGDVERSLDAGDTAADHQHLARDGNGDRLQRLVASGAAHGAARNLDRLLGRDCLVLVHPGALLADVGDLASEAVQAGALGVVAESLFMQVGRTAGDHHAVQIVVLDGLEHRVLPRVGTHVNIVLGGNNTLLVGHRFRHLLHVNGGGDVVAAVADENACALFGHDFAPAVFMASTPYS